MFPISSGSTLAHALRSKRNHLRDAGFTALVRDLPVFRQVRRHYSERWQPAQMRSCRRGSPVSRMASCVSSQNPKILPRRLAAAVRECDGDAYIAHFHQFHEANSLHCEALSVFATTHCCLRLSRFSLGADGRGIAGLFVGVSIRLRRRTSRRRLTQTPYNFHDYCRQQRN